MQYTVQNSIHIVAVPVQDFKIVMIDDKKKNSPKNSCNAGFFGNYKENGSLFTLPVGHLICDYDAKSTYTKKYCAERGKFNGNKFTFDSGSFAYNNNFYGKAQSTFCIKNDIAYIDEMDHAPNGCSYAIAGVPIMRNFEDVKFATFVKNQGWDASTLYATWHVFVGVKEVNAKTVYVMVMKTTKSNMITAAEAFKKFKELGFRDVIKLDGGGSFYFNADGTTKCTLENRRINTIITFDGVKNPYPIPTVALTYLNKYNKDYNKWLQWELTAHGFECEVDGSFGPNTLKQLKAFQQANGLDPDGSCGPATRKALLN